MNTQLRLHGKGWKVSVAGAILPPMSLFPDLQSENENLMQIWFDVHGVSPSLNQNRKRGMCMETTLKKWKKKISVEQELNL